MNNAGTGTKVGKEIGEETSDEELMLRVAARDEAAFKVLAGRYTKLLYSVAYRMFPSREDADDIVQESLLRIWEKASLWKEGKGAAVSTWIYRLAYNLCIDHKRKDRMQKTEIQETDILDKDTSEKKLEQKQLGNIVARAISALPERQRMAIVLCHYQGHSNAEAAEIIGTSVKGVEGLLVRARQALQHELKEYKGAI